ncbi:zinc-dependent metalloprotease [Candidatus Poriferisodalis sp.]|uniref:zinc-dependent metalloprotease n=1 Tax=Candidatus Poriferisodalis sp. TaxID=3101277 RepID=UPI003D0DE87D
MAGRSGVLRTAAARSANDVVRRPSARQRRDVPDDEHVDWDLARRIAVRVADTEPLYRSYLARSLRDDFARFVPIASELVAAETGLSSAGDARAEVIDRAGWIDANIAAFRRLLKPLLGGTSADGEPSGATRAGRTVGAVELGTVLGWMARRVLGQYDLLWASDDDTESAPRVASDSAASDSTGDVVYFVGPNILVTEKRFAFSPAQFRLWLALHELTHRAQFTGVPWLRPHFLELVNGLVDEAQPDPDRLREGLRKLVAQRRSGNDVLGEGGLAAVFATEHQRGLISQVGGMMSLVEGHGDVTMARAARGHIPDAERFALVMHHRRRSARGMARLVQRLLGIEAKLAQYQAGEDFIAEIEAERGPRAVDRIWERVEHLPSMAEIREPAAWLERVPAV